MKILQTFQIGLSFLVLYFLQVTTELGGVGYVSVGTKIKTKILSKYSPVTAFLQGVTEFEGVRDYVTRKTASGCLFQIVEQNVIFYDNCRNSRALIGQFLLSICGQTHEFEIRATRQRARA